MGSAVHITIPPRELAVSEHCKPLEKENIPAVASLKESLLNLEMISTADGEVVVFGVVDMEWYRGNQLGCNGVTWC